MQIIAKNISKRFINQWVIKDFNYLFSYPKSYALVGSNGSGKSTLLQILAGFSNFTKGEISYLDVQSKEIEEYDVFKLISISTPYLELVEELTLKEHIEFHFKFKPKIEDKKFQELFIGSGLNSSLNKQVKFFSSGMKQRLKLVLAFGTDVPLLFLDEPTSNLDEAGVNWYLKNIHNINSNRLTIIASNILTEYSFCNEVISIEKYK